MKILFTPLVSIGSSGWFIFCCAVVAAWIRLKVPFSWLKTGFVNSKTQSSLHLIKRSLLLFSRSVIFNPSIFKPFHALFWYTFTPCPTFIVISKWIRWSLKQSCLSVSSSFHTEVLWSITSANFPHSGKASLCILALQTFIKWSNLSAEPRTSPLLWTLKAHLSSSSPNRRTIFSTLSMVRNNRSAIDVLRNTLSILSSSFLKYPKTTELFIETI